MAKDQVTGVPFRTHKCLSSMASMVSNPFLGAESDSLDPLKNMNPSGSGSHLSWIMVQAVLKSGSNGGFVGFQKCDTYRKTLKSGTMVSSSCQQTRKLQKGQGDSPQQTPKLQKGQGDSPNFELIRHSSHGIWLLFFPDTFEPLVNSHQS